MRKDIIKNIAIIFLLAIASFAIYKYTITLREKYDLTISLGEANMRITGLEKDKISLLRQKEELNGEVTKLSWETAKLKNYAKAAKKRMSRLFVDTETARRTAEDIQTKQSLLKAENESILKEKEELLRENDSLKLKLSSVKELKKAMLELRKQAPGVVAQVKKKMEEDENLEGNRGFLLKDGQPTTATKIKIEVIPAQIKKQ
ncbi:MAG: hypothetical protein ABSB18_04040 [Candidatus Omnitrophota bacterium]